MVILQSELGYSTTGGPKPALYILLTHTDKPAYYSFIDPGRMKG